MLLISSYKKISIVTITMLVDNRCFFLKDVSVFDLTILISILLVFVIFMRVIIAMYKSQYHFRESLKVLGNHIITEQRLHSANLKKAIVIEKLDKKLNNSILKINTQLLQLQKFIIEK